MKKLSTTFLVTGVLIASTPTLAQIPVTDSASITQQTMAQIETITKWKMQYEQMISQIDQAKQQYNSLTGSRGLGNIMNDPALRDYLPADWQGVYDSVRSGGYSGLSSRAQSIYDENRLFDSCAHMAITDQRTVCEALAVKASQDKGFALDAYDAAKSRINQIDQLMAKINQTEDPKAISELQGRIAAEQANIQNEQTKLQMYQMVAAAEDRIQQQRQDDLKAKANARRGWVRPQTVHFGN